MNNDKGIKHVLFICSRNRLRSPTAEHLFSTVAGVEVASAGLSNDAEVMVTPELLQWADRIFVMERVHRVKLRNRFGKWLNGKSIICLEIPDEYEFMDPVLIEILRKKMRRYFAV